MRGVRTARMDEDSSPLLTLDFSVIYPLDRGWINRRFNTEGLMHTWGVVGYEQKGDADPIQAFHVRAESGADAVALVRESGEADGLVEVVDFVKLLTDTPSAPGILWAGPAPVRLGRSKPKA